MKLKRIIYGFITAFFLCFFVQASFCQDITNNLISIIPRDTGFSGDSVVQKELQPDKMENAGSTNTPSEENSAINITSVEIPEPSEEKPDETLLDKFSKPFPLFQPILGLGGGWLMYMGDLTPFNATKKIKANLGINFSISTQTNKYLSAGLYFLKGRFTVDEKTATRNLNFQSRITCGGVYVRHNFANWIPQNSRLHPYMSMGFEAFEFNSKGDTLDANGNAYYYWKDGSIRIEPELGINPNAATTKLDYLYESDLREANIDGLGNYSQFSLAVPVGVGIQYYITPRIVIDLGTSLHFTFTDLLDNVSAEGRGIREGNSDLEKFLYTSLSLKFNIVNDVSDEVEQEIYKQDSIIAVLENDTIEEIIIDSVDIVLNDDSLELTIADNINVIDDTLKVTIVDPDTSLVSDVNLEVTLDDSTTYDKPVFEELPYETTEPQLDSVWTVLLGTFPKGEYPSKEFTNQILSMSEVQSIVVNDTTFYIKGKFNNLETAEATRIDITENTLIKNSKVALWLPTFDTNIKLDKAIVPAIIEAEAKIDTTEFVFRVQLGAFNRLIPTAFFGINDVVMIPGKDGLYKYVTGEFSDYENATKYKQTMISKGFNDAFIVIYRGGMRVSLNDARVYPDRTVGDSESTEDALTDKQDITKEDSESTEDVLTDKQDIIKEDSESTEDVLTDKQDIIKEDFESTEDVLTDKRNVTKIEFKIQIFASQEPIYMVPSNFKGLENIVEYIDEGLYKYTFGISENFEYARDVMLNQMKRLGYKDAFVIGFINGKRTTLLKAHGL